MTPNSHYGLCQHFHQWATSSLPLYPPLLSQPPTPASSDDSPVCVHLRFPGLRFSRWPAVAGRTTVWRTGGECEAARGAERARMDSTPPVSDSATTALPPLASPSSPAALPRRNPLRPCVSSSGARASARGALSRLRLRLRWLLCGVRLPAVIQALGGGAWSSAAGGKNPGAAAAGERERRCRRANARLYSSIWAGGGRSGACVLAY